MAGWQSKNSSGGAAKLPKIRRRRIADEVYDRIRAAILEKNFLPGDRLNIPELATRFDVSQMPVRQAIGRLADAGLVEIKPRSGTFVAKIDAEDVAQSFEIRRALECLAGESAVQNVTDAELARIENLIVELEASVGANGDAERHDQLNTEFHRRIVALSRNGKLVEMYEQLNAHIKIARIHLSSGGWARRVDLEKKEHREIARALRERKASRLVKALRSHIERSKQVLIADLAATKT